MTKEDLFSSIQTKFSRIEKAPVEVRSYLTIKLVASDLLSFIQWLKTEMGFHYLDIITAVDYMQPVDAKGYVMDPNPNVFLPEGATPQVEHLAKTPNFPYRDVFEVVYCLSNLDEKIKIFLKVEVPRSAPKIASLYSMFKAADWQEREIFDLFGIQFEGHPNLTKILTPEFIQGHPLRKDYVHQPDRFD
jgi:NADH:ubiquinone oxidoreductase subunit C